MLIFRNPRITSRLEFRQELTVFVKNFCSVDSAPDDLTARMFEITSANWPFNLLLALASFFCQFCHWLGPVINDEAEND